MQKSIITVIFIFTSFFASAQVKRVLFLGNSYTYVNDLPGMISALASSAGDSLYTDANTPGGYTLGWEPIDHKSNSTSLEKIRYGIWDYVVLQEQSQIPSIPALRDSCMIPASISLYDSVKYYNPCAKVLFYLTWGRRFGGVQCFVPEYCSINFADYGQMQDSITRSYQLISEILNEPVAPVGEAWRLVLDNTNMILHSSDNSHPSINGSYLAACVFYSGIFKNHSYGLPFTAGLMSDSAAILQQAADSVVFSNPGLWNLWENDPEAIFTYDLHNDTLSTSNHSSNSDFYFWNFGDGSFSTESEPVHVYDQSGNYNVILRACDSCRCDTVMKTIIININSSGVLEGNEKVVLSGPDDSGNIRFINFTRNGILRIRDLTGRNIMSVCVEGGNASINGLPRSVYVWELFSNKAVVARGKMF